MFVTVTGIPSKLPTSVPAMAAIAYLKASATDFKYLSKLILVHN